MTEKEKMQKQMLYDANNDRDLSGERAKAKELCYQRRQTALAGRKQAERAGMTHGKNKANGHFLMIGEMVICVLDFVSVEDVQHFIGRHHIGLDGEMLDVAGYGISVGSVSCLHNHLIENYVVGVGKKVRLSKLKADFSERFI